MQQNNILSRVFNFYYQGFRQMTVGKKLWAIILIKLFVMFVILKFFFFKDFLGSHFHDDRERSDYVIEQLTSP
jgi:TM2 domain-containing membrane protein YozV